MPVTPRVTWSSTPFDPPLTSTPGISGKCGSRRKMTNVVPPTESPHSSSGAGPVLGGGSASFTVDSTFFGFSLSSSVSSSALGFFGSGFWA